MSTICLMLSCSCLVVACYTKDRDRRLFLLIGLVFYLIGSWIYS